MHSQDNPFEAFVDGPRSTVSPTGKGPLSGLTFAVKDLIDVAGVPTGGGNPDWERTHPVPDRHAPSVARLLANGAEMIGKTRTDEISLGILGENVHYGMPVNPASPERVPGGSSSGSAVAVAAGLADFALGTDTGGSVRVPSSFCGLFGIRPSHGSVDFTGVVAQALDYDTVGWFARDAAMLETVGTILLDTDEPHHPVQLLVAEDAFRFADDDIASALAEPLSRLAAVIGSPRNVTVASQGLSVWQGAQRVLQSSQAARHLGPWLAETNPRLAFTVARALLRGQAYTDEERGRAALMKREANQRMHNLLADGSILALPTTPFVAPLRTEAVSGYDRDRISCLTSIAGLSGLPQVNLPWRRSDGVPVGLSIVGARGSDRTLLAIARKWEEAGR